MEQILLCQTSNDLPSSTTEFNCIITSTAWTSTENSAKGLISTDGIIKQLRVDLQNAPGVGKSFTFTLRVNGAGSALTVTLSDAETSKTDSTHEVDVEPGDEVSLECDPDSTPTVGDASWSMVFEGDTSNESLILGGGTMPPGGVYYWQLNSRYRGAVSSENDSRVVCPTDGDIENLYVEFFDGGGDAVDYDVTLRVNGAPSTLTCTCNAGGTANDLVHSVAVSAGDILTVSVDAGGDNPSGQYNFGIGMTFIADTDGESLILGGAANYDVDEVGDRYSVLSCGDYSGWTSDESIRYGYVTDACILKKFYVLADAAPEAGKSWEFKSRISTGDGNLSVTIADAATTGNDVVNSDSLNAGGRINLANDPDGSPNPQDTYWGIVCYIAPSGGEPQPDPEPEVTYRLRPLD